MYRRIRNTFRFLVNNLYDFDPAANTVAPGEMEELDRWILNKMDELVVTATAAYETYEYHRVYQATLNFCSVELSAFYLDVLKDRLYASGKDWRERRSAQTALHQIAETLAKLLAPILVHTSEEVLDYLKLPNPPESIHLADFPTAAGTGHRTAGAVGTRSGGARNGQKSHRRSTAGWNHRQPAGSTYRTGSRRRNV